MSSLELALQRLRDDANSRKDKDIYDAAKGALEHLQAIKLASASSIPNQRRQSTSQGTPTSTHSIDESNGSSSSPDHQAVINKTSSSIDIVDSLDAEEYWSVFKLALAPTASPKVKIAALHSLNNFIAHGRLVGDSPLTLPPATKPTPVAAAAVGRPKFAAFSEVNDLSHIDCSDPTDHLVPNLPGANTVGPDHYPSPPRLIDEIVHTICMTYRGASSTDADVQLQIAKILLTLVTSTTCHVHHATLLKIIQTSCNIFCWAKTPILQATAKAGLTQMVNLVISKMETDAHTLRDIEKLLKRNSIVVQRQGLDSEELDTETLTEQLDSESSTELVIEQQEGEPEQVTIITEHVQELQVEDQNQDQDEAQDEAQGQQEANAEAVAPNDVPLPPSPVLERSPVAAVAQPEPPKPKEMTPHEAALAACRLSRQDAYLTFRLLCKLSLRADIAPNNAQQEELSIRGRALVLELILSMMNNSGPVFQSDNLFVSAVRQYLCVSLSQNGVSANETLFEFSLSLFLTVLRYYRTQLKAEVEVLFNEFYLKFLDMSNATLRQKEMVLQGLHKICSNPQTIVDIYLNFDCDISMASVFEHIVNSLSRIAQGRGKVNASTTVGNMMGKQLLLNEKDAWALIQDRRLAVQGLRCMVSVLDSLVDWSKDVGSVLNLPEAINAAVNASTNGHARDASADIVSTVVTPASPQNETTSNDSASGSPLSPARSTAHYNKMAHPVIVSKNPLLAMSMRTQQSSNSNSNLSSTSVNTVGSGESLGDDHPAEFEEIMTRKQLFLKGVKLFNTKPIKGIDFFIKQGFVQDDVQAIAAYLMTTPSLDKAAIGEYIGEVQEKAVRVMHAFVDRLDFTGVGYVDSLRMFLQQFRLPGESQKIDRLLEKFADRYCETNPKVFANADTAFILAFSVIMLNTDQHSGSVKKRMQVSDFIKNNRGINDNSSLPDEYLSEIFHNISTNEIVLEEEQAREASKANTPAAGTIKQRQELYDMAISQMQKNARALLTGNDRVRSIAAWRHATHAEHAKPMFAVACWPVMATLSLAFEEAIDPSIFASKSEPKSREFAAINAEAIDLCLRGMTNAIRIASIFHMDVERDAFISSLAKLTGMNHVSEMQPKNVLAIRTLLKVANTMGEYLEGNWNLVLKTISAMEQLQLIPRGGRVSTEGFNGIDYQHIGNGGSPGSSAPPTPQVSSRRKASLSAMMNEFQSQDTIIAIDKIFANSTALSGDAIVHLFKSICAVSLDEVEGSKNAPRMYMLQRIIEIADYNMVRIRFEWMQIWRILQAYFNAVGCSTNTNVSTFAIDSLRQLAMKFLARDELAHFNTQNELLRPFEHIYKNNPSAAIHDLIIQSLRQMITARASNIRSGWKPMFGVFGRTATHGNGALVENAFGIVQMIYENSFDVIETSFVDYVNCLVEFCFNYDEKVVNGAMVLLKKCARGLLTEARAGAAAKEEQLNLQQPHVEKHLVLGDGQSKETAIAEEDEDTFFLKWFPIVYGLSRVVIDSELPSVRSQALVSLFEILNGSGEIFESQYWSKIYRVVLMPIFEDLKDPDYKRRDLTSTIWIQALRLMINLYSRQYHQVFYAQTDFLKGLLELITLLVSKKSENLGQMGIICLSQLVTKNGTMFDEERWELITATLETIFEMTTPHEVMVLDTGASADGTSQADGSSNAVAPAVPANPAPKFDFQETVTKCAIHLVAITFVKDMALVDLSLWPSSSSPYTSHHVSAPGNPAPGSQHGQVPSPTESMAGSRSSSFSAAPGSIEQQIPAIKPRFLHNMPTGLRHRWLECLRKSYRFVRAFNDNYELRHYLYKSGQIQQMPNMFKQENLALTTYVSVLFDFYRQFGDGDGYDAEDEIQAVLEPLVQESKLIVARYLGMLSEPSKYPKDVIVNQSQLTIMVLRELQRTPIWWPNAAMISSSHDGRSSPTSNSSSNSSILSKRSSPTTSPSPTGLNGSSSAAGRHHQHTTAAASAASIESDKRKYQGLRKELPDYFRLAIRLVGVERTDVRVALQEFMGRVGELLVLE